MKDPTIPEEKKDELREQQKMHMHEANNQRRAMNAFIEAIKKEKAPDDALSDLNPVTSQMYKIRLLKKPLSLRSMQNIQCLMMRMIRRSQFPKFLAMLFGIISQRKRIG